MPQWAGSSWYFLRYIDPKNADALASKEALEYWTPIDWYNGGIEHTTLHLLYSRFLHKFLYDIGVVPTCEPYQKRTSHGMILGENGEKMSKSRGNVVNPDDVVAQYGADTLRLFIMFIGDFEKAAPWSSQSIKGCKRFLERVFNLLDIMQDGDDYGALEKNFHKAIKKVSADIEDMKFNTAIATLMALLNDIVAQGSITKKALSDFIIMLSPFAPHLAEEMWQLSGHNTDITNGAVWPSFDESKTVDDSINIPVQINGKLRGLIAIAPDMDQDAVLEMALADEKVKAAIDGKAVFKTIYVKNKLINLVVK